MKKPLNKDKCSHQEIKTKPGETEADVICRLLRQCRERALNNGVKPGQQQ